MEISLCMIAKNEERLIGRSLNSAKTLAGLKDLVVADTGSTDRTKEIALEHGARVFDFTWCDDFSAARNFAAGKALNDWVLVLDADEEIMEIDVGEIQEFIKNPCSKGSVVKVDAASKDYYHEARLYNKKYHRYKGVIHEQLRPIDGNSAESALGVPVVLAHYGYLGEIYDEKNKFERNLKLLSAALDKEPDNPYLMYQLGMNWLSGKTDWLKAGYYFEKVLSINPPAELEYVYKTVERYGYALINTGQYKKALEVAERYKEAYNGYTEFRFLLGCIYQNNGALIEAVECFESCVGARERGYKGISSFLSYYNIGVILECVGMTDDAREMYIKCGDYEPAAERLKAIT